jgi:hypothetical protein
MIHIVMVIGCRSGLLRTTVEDMSGSSSIPPHRLHPQNLTRCMQSIHKILRFFLLLLLWVREYEVLLCSTIS